MRNECGCDTSQMLGASTFCPHTMERHDDEVRSKYLTTLAADLDEGALNAAENAIIPILKDPDSGYFEILRAAIQAYLSALTDNKRDV